MLLMDLKGKVLKSDNAATDKGEDHIMTSSNGNSFRVTGPWCRWIPRTKASDAEFWYFLWSTPE